MYLAFVDDSEERQPKRNQLGHLVGVGAVMLPETSLATYASGIRGLRDELGVPPETELKWSPGDGSWLKGKEGNAVRTQLRSRMLGLAAAADARSIVLIWDRAHLNWETPEIRDKLLRWLYDKVSTFLARRGSLGMVVADEPGGGPAQRAAWLRDTLPLTDEGTTYTRPGQIVLPIVTARSDHVPHLQLADLIVSATVAAVAGNPHAIGLLPYLGPLADRLPADAPAAVGRVGGAGLTLWPPWELMDLYWHLYGDEASSYDGTLWPLGPAADTPFAQPGRPFWSTDGLS